ncbi:MAG: MerR family transcriptional regulator [Pirellulaceae bacterium]
MDTAGNAEIVELRSQRVALQGRLAGMSRKQVFAALRDAGAIPVEKLDDRVDIIVFGEDEVASVATCEIDPALQLRAAEGQLRFITETTLWQWLGLIEPRQKLHRMYTPAMLAEVLGVSKSIVRRWHRRGLIVPAREVRNLPYFDYHEVATARSLAQMLASGMSPERIERQLSAISQYLPDVQRPLAQLSIIVQGREILLRQGEGLVEPGGQMRFDFDAVDDLPEIFALDDETEDDQRSPQAWIDRAADHEDAGELDEAIDCLRSAFAGGGLTAARNFQLAELLYRQGSLAAAVERYHVTLELDPHWIEARCNLGCVLMEMDRPHEAMAALEAALEYYPDYCDAHYHLADLLDQLGYRKRARKHWEQCLALGPDMPWADEAAARLEAG